MRPAITFLNIQLSNSREGRSQRRSVDNKKVNCLIEQKNRIVRYDVPARKAREGNHICLCNFFVHLYLIILFINYGLLSTLLNGL